MADNEKKPDVMVDEKSSNITDFLQAPRKKRKNYVILALGENFDRDVQGTMEGYIKKSHSGLALSNPKSAQELTRQFGRNISLLVIDDQFEELDIVIEIVKKLKVKRREDGIPVLFLTRSPADLIRIYHDNLLAYHEGDEYLVWNTASPQKIIARIKDGIESKNKRRARRYPINHNVTFFHLDQNRIIPGRFVDLSLHGALLESEEGSLFKEGDQLRVNIPTAPYLSLDNGDFLKLAARVRRVFISGNLAAISFEYLSEYQLHKLTTFLTGIVNRHLQKQKGRMLAAARERS